MTQKQARKKAKELLKELLGLFWPSLALWRTFEAELLQKIDYSPPVLDLGCGQGFFSKVIFKKIDVGLDNCRQDLKIARRLGIYERLVCCSARNIPYPKNYFRTVLANCVMEHIPRPEGIISEISRVLKKGGRFIFTVPSTQFSSMLLFKNKHYIAFRNNSLKHFNLYSVAQWEEILNSFNLKLEKRIKYLDDLTLFAWELMNLVTVPSLWGKCPALKAWEITPKWFWQKLLTRPLSIFLERMPKKKNGANLLIARKL